MTGSLQIKNDKYYLVLNLINQGKRRQKWISTGLSVKGNKRRAEQLLRETLQQYQQQGGSIPCDVLFSDYVRYWLEQVRRRVDEVTWQGYESLAKCHILPYFDKRNLLLREVTRADLQTYLDAMASDGRKDGKGGLSPKSIRLHKNILHQTLNEAVKNGVINNNPCQLLDLPSVPRYEAHFYDEQQLQTLLQAAKGDPLYSMIQLAMIYGLRRSELLGLKWDSIDFVRKTMTIRHTVSKVTKAVAKDKTKTASSYRSFPLTEDASRLFQQLRAEEMQNHRLMGKDYQENDYIFKWSDGRPFPPDYVTHHFSRLLKKHDLPHIRFHELRHSCASLLLNRGFTLKDVQEWMGHSDISVTANIYGHLDIARKQSIAASMTELLHPDAPGAALEKC